MTTKPTTAEQAMEALRIQVNATNDEDCTLSMEHATAILKALQSEREKADGVDYRALLLSFIGSLTLCDHMGDVSNDISDILKTIGLKIEWDDLSDLGNALGKMGVKTHLGTTLGSEEEE